MLWSSIKQIKAPYVFDWEHVIALHAMQRNRASSRSEWELSWPFSSCGGMLGYIFKVRREWSFKTHVCSMTSGLLSSFQGTLMNLHEAWQINRHASRCEEGDPVSLSSFHSDIGISINFHGESGIVTF